MKCRLLACTWLAVLFAFSAFAQAQITVAITGNSLAQFQLGFESDEFQPTIAPHVQILGIDGAYCSTFLTPGPTGQPAIFAYVPASAQVAVLIEGTNDAKGGVSIDQHMECMNTTISLLQNRNNDLRVIVVNTPPFGIGNCYGDFRDEIDIYNNRYVDPDLGFEANHQHIKVADVWTPAALWNGWANPQYMLGPCKIHPDQAGQWSASWGHFAEGYEGLVLTGLNKQW